MAVPGGGAVSYVRGTPVGPPASLDVDMRCRGQGQRRGRTIGHALHVGRYDFYIFWSLIALACLFSYEKVFRVLGPRSQVPQVGPIPMHVQELV